MFRVPNILFEIFPQKLRIRGLYQVSLGRDEISVKKGSNSVKSRYNIYPFGIYPLSWRVFVWNWEEVTQMKGRKITLDRSPL